MRRLSMPIVCLACGAVGVAVGVFAGSGPASVRRWLPGIQRQMDEQGQVLRRQQVALDAITVELSASKNVALIDQRSREPRGPVIEGAGLGNVVPDGEPENGGGTNEAAAKAQALLVAGEEARQKAASIVNRAISRGIWSEEDVKEMRPLVGVMSGPQREQTMAELFVALNDGRVKPSGGFPFLPF